MLCLGALFDLDEVAHEVLNVEEESVFDLDLFLILVNNELLELEIGVYF